MIQYDIACSDKAFDVEGCRKAAESGYPPAQYSLGFCYEIGHGVSRDEGKAFSWYKNAANEVIPLPCTRWDAVMPIVSVQNR